MERLAGAILLKAVEDWNDPRHRPEVEQFLDSEWFQELADILHVEPVTIQTQLKAGTYQRVSMRAAYR